MFVDADVFYSRTLRDWLGMLYATPDAPPFIVCWTEDVLAETIYRLRRAHPDWDGARISRMRDAIAGSFEGGRVDAYSPGAYPGADPNDAHVHAAAVAAQADYLVTGNTKDLSWDADSAPYEVLTPDEFFVLVDQAMGDLVDLVAQKMSDYWVERSGEADLPARLVAAGCPEFAVRVRTHLQRHM